MVCAVSIAGPATGPAANPHPQPAASCSAFRSAASASGPSAGCRAAAVPPAAAGPRDQPGAAHPAPGHPPCIRHSAADAAGLDRASRRRASPPFLLPSLYCRSLHYHSLILPSPTPGHPAAWLPPAAAAVQLFRRQQHANLCHQRSPQPFPAHPFRLRHAGPTQLHGAP